MVQRNFRECLKWLAWEHYNSTLLRTMRFSEWPFLDNLIPIPNFNDNYNTLKALKDMLGYY